MTSSRDYPIEAELQQITQWRFTTPPSFVEFLAFVKACWWMAVWGWQQEGRTYHISTGGWSRNEDLIGAMERHRIFWAVCWMQSRRGGHYIFELPNPKTYFGTPPGAATTEATDATG
jgi:hypothetical protein